MSATTAVEGVIALIGFARTARDVTPTCEMRVLMVEIACARIGNTADDSADEGKRYEQGRRAELGLQGMNDVFHDG